MNRNEEIIRMKIKEQIKYYNSDADVFTIRFKCSWRLS